MNKVNKKLNIFNDNIGFVEQYDFSTANMSEENRILAVSLVASICYQNPKAVGSESLYNRLMAESIGLPSSSFEMVPVLISAKQMRRVASIVNKEDYIKHDFELNIAKFGQMVEYDKFMLTNLRALIADVGDRAKEFYNTAEECEIIKQHFKVFKYKVDLPTRSQMVRHRVSWQELSRRYVSGKRVPNEFYLNSDMDNIEFNYKYKYKDHRVDLVITPDELLSMSNCLYLEALDKKVKPQSARRIIPQAAYTQIWGAFQPKQLDNYFKLRLDEHSQWEIRQTALAMQELIQGDK